MLPIFKTENTEAESEPLAVFCQKPTQPNTVLPVIIPASTETKQQTAAVFSVPPPHIPQSSIMIFSTPETQKKNELPVFCLPHMATPDQKIVTAELQPAVPQTQRAIDRQIRMFLIEIRARDIRYRRVGHTTYSWLHEQTPEPMDAWSDVRWEIKVTAQQISLGVYDIKPFFRIIATPVDVPKLKSVWTELQNEMKQDAGG